MSDAALSRNAFDGAPGGTRALLDLIAPDASGRTLFPTAASAPGASGIASGVLTALRPERGPNFWRYVFVYALALAAASAAAWRSAAAGRLAVVAATLGGAFYANVITDRCMATGSADPSCRTWAILWLVVCAVAALGEAVAR